ncbi:zeatin O-glucosyltransferase-like [Typha latifolia]|uniref:zeatin O-glucosyltransferase-like n=1 Tax=Typha latifolia TaxID=4733 RepID=UPI003C2B8E48
MEGGEVSAAVVVPLPAQGHLNQLLHLARLLSSRGIAVHYVGSASHNRQARDRAGAALNSTSVTAVPIEFHDLHLPPFASPPPDPLSPTKFPTHLQPAFDAAALHLAAPLEALLRSLASSHRRVALIHDSTMSFAAAAASSVPNVCAFSFHSVSAFALLLYQWESRGRPPFDDLHLPPISNRDCFSEQFLEFVRRQHRMIAPSSGRLINTCRAIEGNIIDMLIKEPNWLNEKTFVIGPLNPIPSDRTAGARHACLRWLDEQPPASVLYVSFGTTSSLSQEQVAEIGAGLEAAAAAGIRFILVLREADKADIYGGGGSCGEDDELRKKLPLDYDRRVERVGGKVVRGWAPQVDILGHPSTGGFLSHCGWNSCMESISMGVPILAWPMHSDQPRNAVLVTQVLSVGFMARDWARRNEVLGSGDVKESIARLMVSNEGNEVRKKARSLGVAVREAMMDGGTSKVDMDAFIDHVIH